ncbi:nucleotide-binding universal stress UspA family protein [Halohasta litchfieldiae]|jgi:nucleotide-binding universal stress UspA family protein|uniref:Nucleotide-binding universal stress protein, UspA family n=1 Tax=Halohasta litchfieldiae TaxID=1073996 RepID=A0A1H6XTR1_9EURY|nr:universal stress protein [Halohasta litchfieldiae]ATW89023.1 nucleotide-binding universal stress UspA family protein [Halohasta litchfieldiae]SEJ28282.1 Nucleotide-binding universal stress protein, UspA family [Halohasta litchfieldiae]
MTRRLLVPLDGSPQSKEALRYAVETFPDADLVVVHVLNPAAGISNLDDLVSETADVLDEQETLATELFETAREIAGEERLVDTELLSGRAASEIVTFAQDNAVDEIVMGSHGRDGAARLLLGSVAETVVRRSPVPVTVVR